MSDPFDSIYPEFLRSGLGKLNQTGAHREVRTLFAALEHFRRDLHAQENAPGLLQVSHRYIAGLDLFRASGFYLVNPSDFGFELVSAMPEAERARLEAAVGEEIRTGRFAKALRQTTPFFFETGSAEAPERGVLHVLALSNQVLGMFSGLLQPDLESPYEIALSLLSMLLGVTADTLGSLRKTAQLTSQIKTLSGLLPICAWCRKVRDDRGYWAQIEQFVQTHTDASFSHSICPDCRTQFFARSAPPG